MAVKTIHAFKQLCERIIMNGPEDQNYYSDEAQPDVVYISKALNDGANDIKLWYSVTGNGRPVYLGYTGLNYFPNGSLIVDDTKPTIKPKPQWNYPMSHKQILDLANSRLAKYGLSMENFSSQWNDKHKNSKILKLENIPGCKKRFCYDQPRYCSVCSISYETSPKQVFFGCNLDDVDSDFMKEGRLQASSTYIKIPLAFRLIEDDYAIFYDRNKEHEWNKYGSIAYNLRLAVCRTPEEINAWFDKFDAYYSRLQEQAKITSEVFDYVKTNGKPYKDIMKTYTKRTQQYKDARKNYEDMILGQIKRITALDKINNDF